MAIALNVQVTGIKDVVSRLQRLDKEQKTLTRRAINDTADHVRTLAVRSVRGDYPSLKAGYVRSMYAIRKATANNLEAIVTASGRPLNLMGFNPKQTSLGVAYRGKRKGKNFIRSAFLATMRSGHQGVFVRRTKKRLPIVEKFMPAVHMMWSPYVDEQLPLGTAFLRKRILQLLERERLRQ